MSKQIDKNRFVDKLFLYFGIACTAFGLIMLAIFLYSVLKEGLARLDPQFFSSLPSRRPERAGILVPLLGTIWIMVLTSLISIPLGVASGVYLEEYGKKNRIASLIEINITNLAGVPSIIYGLLALEIFVRILGLGHSLLAGSLTLSLLILPIIIVATREALKAVPKTIREASFALGATKWQTTWFQVIPAASGGIVTGVILAISRAIGETAPLIVIGGSITGIDFDPSVIRIAQQDNGELENAIFKVVDIENDDVEESSFDFIFCRFIVSHLQSPEAGLQKLYDALKPDGILAIEDVDFQGHFCYPPNHAFNTYVRWYEQVGIRKGSNPMIGPLLLNMVTGLAMHDIDMNVVLPTFHKGEGKLMGILTLQAIRDTLIKEGITGEHEVDETILELQAFTDDKTSIMSLPRIFQVSAKK